MGLVQGEWPTSERHVDQAFGFWPWLTAQPWYKPNVVPGDLYPDAIANLLGVKSDRREFFEQLINPPEISPSRGYVALTQILHQGWISTVLTTNFDQCLERAAIQHNRPHRLVSISTPADYIMFSSVPQDPQLIFLHGSVKHYTDKNLADEIQSLDGQLVDRLKPLLRDHPIIVVGYRGTETSVMNDLFLAQAGAGGFLHGVYWCVLDSEVGGPFSSFVTQLADQIGSNFQLVPIKGFDDLVEKDLLASMIVAGARPTRRQSGHSIIGMPADMRPLDGFDISGFEQSLLQARLGCSPPVLLISVSDPRERIMCMSESLALPSRWRRRDDGSSDAATKSLCLASPIC
jgi:hypothetical protein